MRRTDVGMRMAVWSRIDAEKGRAIPLAHSRMKLADVSRQLYAELGIALPAGLANRADADPLNYDRPIWQQAKRLGEDPPRFETVDPGCMERVR